MIDRMLVKATGYALLYTTMPIVSACVHEKRPDGNGKHSFPSFKTANAFLAAEQIRIERGWAWGMGVYTIAAGIGVMQMYNDRSYINDVLAGAGMGILAVHGAYWLLPLERKWFGLDKKAKKKDRGLLILPTYEPVTRTAGFSLAACL
jgi:membrane-associated phospholipid phosphatase